MAVKRKKTSKSKAKSKEMIQTHAMEEKESYEKIVSRAKKQGLPKSTWLRFVALKSLADEL